MLKPLVRRCRVQQVRKSELMDVSKPLKWPRVQNCTFIRIQANKDVNRITNFVDVLTHNEFPWLRAVSPTACTGMSSCWTMVSPRSLYGQRRPSEPNTYALYFTRAR